MKDDFNMVSCINSLAKNGINELEHIIENKYFKFTKFYRLLKSFDGDIKIVNYNDSEDTELSIDVSCTKKVRDSIKKYVEDENLSVILTDSKSILNITIIED